MDSFQYQPLPDNSIRLLEILQESTPESIQCRLLVHDTSACPEYVALSYTWEPRHPQQEIIVNGKPAVIGHNLACYLRHVVIKSWGDYEIKLHWIDQICIDQQSNQEKSHQVSLMHQIYSNAAVVHIWLGEAADDSDYAIQVLHSKRASLVLKYSSKYKFHDERQRLAYCSRHLLSKREKQALGALVRRQYWQRLWIVQEVVLAKKARVFCGCSCVDWPIFANFYENFDNSEFDKSIPWLLLSEAGYKRGLRGSLWVLLQFSASLECSVVQDKVYGLLAIADTNSTGEQLQPDYSKTLHETYDDVLLYLDEPSTKCEDRHRLVIILAKALDMKEEEVRKKPITCSFLDCKDPKCKGLRDWHKPSTNNDPADSSSDVQGTIESDGLIKSVQKKIFNFKK
jgi:hypothetical protein